LNSDDTWFSDTVRHVEAAVTQDPHADIYYGQIRYLDPLTGRSYIRSPDLSRMKQRMNLFHPAMYVRKTGYERVGGYSTDYRLAMDSEWCHRALQAGLRFHRVDSVLATMRLGGQSDKDFRGSLLEYRASLLCHGLSGRLAAGYYFTKYYLLKLLTRPYYLRLLKQVILR
jgi:glycosyltransferase